MRLMNTTRNAGGAARLGPQIYLHLKEQLLTGAYESGSKLSVNDIRDEFGTSRHPVLDALRMLAADGLVEVLPQVGCRVKVYSETEVADFFRIFGGLEGMVAGMAAERRTAAQIEVLRGYLELDGDPDLTAPGAAAEAYQSMNGLFHGVVHDMAASPMVDEVCSRHWDLADFMVNTVGGTSSIAVSLEDRLADHREIAAAIEAGDSVGAARVAEAHVVRSLGPILERLRP
jgi:DNA-binding GntR family transcriptional regulator